MRRDIYDLISELRRSGCSMAVATIVRRKGSTPRKDAAKMLVLEDGRIQGSIGGGCTEADVVRAAIESIRTERPRLLSFDLTEDDAEESGLLCGGTMDVYVEPILPAATLLIFGAGHIGQCIAEIASPLGFRVAIVDDRIKYACRERFPEADEIHVGEWQALFGSLQVSRHHYLVIATRGHRFDLACLRFALQTEARYIGLLGSRRKTKLLFETLAAEGASQESFERVYAPIGLEIGSETPEEIAVSIAAEIIAIRRNLDVRPVKTALRHLRTVPVQA